MADELRGQVAIVTGGGRGFGRAIAEGLAAAGAAVCVTARTTAEIEATVASIEAAGGRAIAVAGDVTVREDVLRVVAATEARLGSVSLLVSNAGIPWPYGPVWEVDPAQWWQAQSVHVLGAMHYMNAVVPGMIERRNGRVIVVSTGAGTYVWPNYSSYSIAKAGQIRLVEHLASEAKPHGVSAFAISPGRGLTAFNWSIIESPEAQKWLPDYVERLRGREGKIDLPAILQTCGDFCARLASGRYDDLSGSFLRAEDDLDDLLAKARQPRERASGLEFDWAIAPLDSQPRT